jgi:YD repeat-containing protein
MISATDGIVTVGYTYDVFGNRVARTQTDSSGTVTERYAVVGWDTAKPSPVGTENFDSGATQPVSGTVAATQSGAWNVGTVTTITSVVHIDDNASTISIDDGSGSITIDGTVRFGPQ